MSVIAKPPVPILRSFDAAATRTFYVSFLGFEVDFEHRFAADLPLYLGVSLGDCALHLSEHHGDATPGAAVRIEVADVVAYAKHLHAKSYKFARPGVVRQAWGFDEMSLTDPSGNRLIFCTALNLTK